MPTTTRCSTLADYMQVEVQPVDRAGQGIGQSANSPRMMGPGTASATLTPRGDLSKRG